MGEVIKVETTDEFVVISISKVAICEYMPNFATELVKVIHLFGTMAGATEGGINDGGTNG